MIYDIKFDFKTQIERETVNCMYCIKPYKDLGYIIMCKRLDTNEVFFNKAYKKKQETSSGRKAYAKLRDFAIDKVRLHLQSHKGYFQEKI